MLPRVNILETETEKRLTLKVTGCVCDVCAAAKICVYEILQCLQKLLMNEKFEMSLNKEVQDIGEWPLQRAKQQVRYFQHKSCNHCNDYAPYREMRLG
ncbi:hypothetical protein AVEN_102518-1 [Araneus ventricosus]|uniref:Uncharacterized protein n=1 Tax=Araneus ventricosus TaxID=182803 RepID=A0A4Y2NJ52_ARAVE|nr:hypothetical protein AVEN_102518-1 [Araneus ventricosus]